MPSESIPSRMTGSPVFEGPGVLLRHARESGGVTPSRIPHFLLLLVRMSGARLGRSLEAAFARQGASETTLPGSGDSYGTPLFILGHYRSGTTLLHKLLAADSRFASVKTFDLFFPTCPPSLGGRIQVPFQGLAKLLGIRQPFFHEYALRLDDPNEMEPLMLALGSEWSSYWGYLFPRAADVYLNRYVNWPSEEIRRGWMQAYSGHLKRVSRRCGGRPLVVKDPPNTARVGTLLELFPRSKFCHVVRDPMEVFISMQALWRDTILPRFALQRISPEDRDALILRHYGVLMEGWESQKNLIPPGNLAEVRYEDLVSDPLRRIREIYEILDLPPFPVAAASISNRLREDQGYRPAESGQAFETLESAERELGNWRTRLGYPTQPAQKEPRTPQGQQDG